MTSSIDRGRQLYRASRTTPRSSGQRRRDRDGTADRAGHRARQLSWPAAAPCGLPVTPGGRRPRRP